MHVRISSPSYNLTPSKNDIDESSKNFDKNKYIELDESTNAELVNLTTYGNECVNYNNLLANNELFRAIKEQFLSDIKHLKNLAHIYLGEQHQDDVAGFYNRINNPPRSEMKEQFNFYVSTRKHIHCLVQKLTADQAQSKNTCNAKSGNRAKKDRDYLVRMLASSLQGMTECIPGIQTRLQNTYNSLMISEKNGSASYFSRIKKERFDHVIHLLIIKFQKEGILDIDIDVDINVEMEVHYFNAFHNSYCEQLGFSRLDDFWAPQKLSDYIKNRIKIEVDAVMSDIFILRDIVEENSYILESILKKHDIPLNSPFSIDLISNALNKEIDKTISGELNTLTKTVNQNTLNVNKFIDFDEIDEDICCFKRHKERLMAWLVSVFFETNLDSKVLTTLPFTENTKLCIGNINNTFFWVFTGDKSVCAGQNCIFNQNNHISLELSHLKSVDFSSWSPDSISYLMLTQALNQTEKTEDIVAFFCDPNVINQLEKIPKKNYQKLLALLNDIIVNDESFKNHLYQSVCEYIKESQFKWQNNQSQEYHSTHLDTYSKLSVTNRMNWLIDTPIIEPILLELYKKNIDISNIKKSLTIEQISRFSIKSIKNIFTEKECRKLFVDSLQSSTEQANFIANLIQIGCCSDLLKTQNLNGMTILHLMAKNGNIDCLKKLLADKIFDVNIKDNKGVTALMYACKNGHIECFEELLTYTNIDINAKDNDANTVLHIACYFNQPKCTKELLVRGVDVNARDNLGFTALMYSSDCNNTECAKQLLAYEQADRNQKDNDGMTALMIACENNRVEYVKELIADKRTDVNAVNNDKNTALMIACENNNVECVKELLTDKRIDVNAIDNDKNTALMIACENNNVESVKELLTDKRTDVNAIDNDKNTALMIAFQNNSIESIQTLLDDKRIDINAGNNIGRTALMFACKNNRYEYVKKLLFDKRIDVNARDDHGNTALHYACINGHITCVQELLNCEKLNVNLKDIEGITAFQHACKNGYIECVKELLTYKTIDVNIKDNYGKTAANYAYENSNYYCLKALVESDQVDDELKLQYYRIFLAYYSHLNKK